MRLPNIQRFFRYLIKFPTSLVFIAGFSLITKGVVMTYKDLSIIGYVFLLLFWAVSLTTLGIWVAKDYQRKKTAGKI
jgi:hypothetical protein